MSGWALPSALPNACSDKDQGNKRQESAGHVALPFVTQSGQNAERIGESAPQQEPQETMEWTNWIQAASAFAVALFTFFLVRYSKRGWKTAEESAQAAKASAEAAKTSADAQLLAMRLTHAPCIEFQNPRTMIGDVTSPEETSYLHIIFDIVNVGSVQIQFRSIESLVKTHGSSDWESSTRLARSIGGGRQFEYSIDAHELTSENRRQYEQARLIVTVKFLVEVFDPVDRKPVKSTYWRRLVCGKSGPPTVLDEYDMPGWTSEHDNIADIDSDTEASAIWSDRS